MIATRQAERALLYSPKNLSHRHRPSSQNYEERLKDSQPFVVFASVIVLVLGFAHRPHLEDSLSTRFILFFSSSASKWYGHRCLLPVICLFSFVPTTSFRSTNCMHIIYVCIMSIQFSCFTEAVA